MNETSPIQAQGVCHYYGEGPLRKQILFDIDLEFTPGEIVILTGPSGSGKTTLLTLAGALRSVQEGSMKVLGHELNGADGETLVKIRNSIGFIFQAHNLLDALTARKNVQMSLALHPGMTQARADEMSESILRDVGLGDRMDYHPSQLSGGQKQRVAIARALVDSPRIVLADEPTAALDKKSGREVVEILRGLAKEKGATILLVTHDNRILDIADTILTLEDGRISSYARGLATSASQQLGFLSSMNRRGALLEHIKDQPADEFMKSLQQASDDLTGLISNLESAREKVRESSLSQALQAATFKLRDLLDADRVTLFLIDETRQVLESEIASGSDGEPLSISIPIDTGFAGHTARTGEWLNVSDVKGHALFNPKVDEQTGYQTRSVLCAPVPSREGKQIAVAQLINKKGGGGFTQEDEQLLKEVIQPLGLILEGQMVTKQNWHSDPASNDKKSKAPNE